MVWADPARRAAFEAWLAPLVASHQLLPATLRPASADASFRRYLRIDTAQGASCIVMDAPPDKENCRPFVQVQALMAEAGLNVPQILAWDEAGGFMLLTDLGKQTLIELLQPENPQAALQWYLQATDVLLDWQKASRPGVLPAYDEPLLRRELSLFPDWYLARHRGVTLTDKQQATLDNAFNLIVAHNLAAPSVFVHRDFMTRNLMAPTLGTGVSSLPPEGALAALGRPGGGSVPTQQGACGHCGSCHAIDVRTHADLCVLMPEVQMMALGWPLSEKAQADIDDKKRKPSREIRVEAMRDAVEFSQRTSARGKGKAVLVYPAEQMNHVTANALLKTLEEPPGDVRFVLASEAAHQLLPTIRSRCLGHTMVWPAEADSLAWLQAQGLARDAAASFLRAAGGRPEDALALAQSGRSPQAWSALPQAVARGDVTALGDWAPAQVIDALQKLCHDLLAASVGAAPRYFAPADLPKTPPLGALTRWSRALSKAARTAGHPFNGGLMLEALVAQARNTLHSRH